MSAEEVLDQVYSDPGRVLEMGRSLADADDATKRDRAIALRAMSIAARVLGDFEESLELASQARDTAAQAGDTSEELLSVIAMAAPMIILGQSFDALELIESHAHNATTPYLSARVSVQRGAVWMYSGELPKAIAAFESALPALREAGDDQMVRTVLQNLGSLRVVSGDLDQAERDLTEALAIAMKRDEEPVISGIEHNLGLLAAYRGDLAEALRYLMDSDEIYMRLTGSSAPQHVARCDVLLSAGLFREANQLASEIAEANRSSGDPEHLGDALLTRARAALLAGDAKGALRTAEEAAASFKETQRAVNEVDARRIAIEARYQLVGPSRDLLRSASEVASKLDSENLMVAAAQAWLLAGLIAIDLGDAERAAEALDPVSRVESGPIELRIQARVARARLRRLRGDARGADAASRSGLRLLDDYQQALGATDVRMGLEQHGIELGEIGLGLALEAGDPRRIFRWMDRTRARALRHRPVLAEKDEEVREALGRLRQVEERLREPQSRNDPALGRERQRLQERVRAADRLKRAAPSRDNDFEIGALVEGLEDRSMLEVAIHDGRLLGVVAQGGRVSRLDLGSAHSVLNELDRVRFAMRRASRRGRPLASDSLETLDRMILDKARIAGDRVIVVPPPRLMALPWGALPSLRDKSVSVSPSAEMWWRATHAERPAHKVVVAGGPDLDVAGLEVSLIGDLYGDALMFPPGSGVEEVKSALGGASVAHVACHATFQVENPMFSALRLGDGDLNIYDIERLSAPPATVVLSACDSGYGETRPGDELAGLTSALLSMGTRSVVASVGLVPDSEATSDLMLDLHRRMIAGHVPSQALSEAQADLLDDPEGFVAAASFVCVGA